MLIYNQMMYLIECKDLRPDEDKNLSKFWSGGLQKFYNIRKYSYRQGLGMFT